MSHALQTTYREGTVDRVMANGLVIIKDMFKRETDMAVFIGQPVTSAHGIVGRITAPFGQTGKVRVEFDGGGSRLVAGEKVAMVRRKFLYQQER
jgi:selenocysteine-specific elongation factor